MERKYALLYLESEDSYAVIYRDGFDDVWNILSDVIPITSQEIAQKVLKVLKGLSS